MLQVKQILRNIQLSEFYSFVKNSDFVRVISFSVLTAISAQISIPTQPVPFTLQTLLVLLSGAFLGPINGGLAQLTYLFMGAFGIPVFANFSGGFPILFGLTGGYLWSFPIVAFLVGLFIQNSKNLVAISLTMFFGTMLILIFGSLYLSLFFNGDLKTSFTIGALGFSVWGFAKTILAIAIFYSYRTRQG